MHQISLQKCKFQGAKIVAKGPIEVLSINEVVAKFAASGSRSAKGNILTLRSGDYIGFTTSKTESGGYSNFILLNGGSNDISRIIRRDPDFETKILEIYLAVDVTIVKNIQELPPTR